MRTIFLTADRRAWFGCAATLVVAFAVTFGGRGIIAAKAVMPDYINHWAVGTLVAGGHSPYDESRLIEIYRRAGWDRATDGRGILDFLPYYYPPWFAVGCTLLVPMGYQLGKLAWFFVNLELLLLSGLLLRGVLPGTLRSIPVVLPPIFLFSLLCLFIGQTTILILFAAVAAWRFVDAGRDVAAGVMLACLTTKPQVALIAVPALGLWAVRHRRWGIVGGFAATLATLCLVSTVLLPHWPSEMLDAPRKTPPPTTAFPWLGNTWFLILKSLGLSGWVLWALYLAVAGPFVRAAITTSWDERRPAGDVLALGLLASFFVVPYARHYDFVVLLIPILVLLDGRLPERSGAVLLIALVVLPYLQFMGLARYSRLLVPGVDFFLECTYFWVPAVVAVLWTATDRGRAVASDGGR